LPIDVFITTGDDTHLICTLSKSFRRVEEIRLIKMISHTPNSLLEKRIAQLTEELNVRIRVNNELRIENASLKKARKGQPPESIDQKRIDELSDALHRQNALIAEMKLGINKQQADALKTAAINKLTAKNEKLESDLKAAKEKIQAYKIQTLNSNIQDTVSTRRTASELADLLQYALDEVSPSISVKDYLERTIHTFRKTGSASGLEHFFIQAVEGFQARADEIRSTEAKTRK